MSAVRSLVRVVVALIVTSMVTPMPCFGWESSPADRMSCCARAHHDCADQQSADACCAQGEQRQHEQAPVSVVVLVPPAPAILPPFPILLDAVATAAHAYQLVIDSRPQRPPYLLTSALLI
jgi:hypothetical protein